MRQKTINAFARFGSDLNEYLEKGKGELGNKIEEKSNLAFHENGWFTGENVRLSLEGIASWLGEDKFNAWLSQYAESSEEKNH